jgi:hypothetical protein
MLDQPMINTKWFLAEILNMTSKYETSFMKHILPIFCALLFFSCQEKSSEYLPKATGKPGEVVLIVDSLQWNGALGTELKKIFRAEVPGLPQEEPMFTVIRAHPEKNLHLLTQLKTLVYVFTLDQKSKGSRLLTQSLSPETIKRIKSDTSFYLSTVKDEYARGQEVMYLFGDTEENLIRHLSKNGKQLIDHLNKLERERLASKLFSATSGITSTLRKEQKVDIKIPSTYRLANKKKNFVWARQIFADQDKDIFITWKPYESEYQLLPDSVMAWRDEIAKANLFEDPKNPISYLVIEKEDAPVYAQQVNFNNKFAMEIRGLWRTNHRTMGGPFLGYALTDESRGLIYYIEGFAYAPGKDKRELMRELETILWSFKPMPIQAKK